MKVAYSSALKPATQGFQSLSLSKRVRRAAVPAVLGFFTFAHGVLACGGYASLGLFTQAREAISRDPKVAAAAIAALREAGPPGLEMLVQSNQSLLDRYTSGQLPSFAAESDAWRRLKTALDEVGKQRDCYASRLYWFTDLDQAKKAAQAAGKPILSLRLLGNLDDDLSCANSRFFRTTLYANTEVANYLRQHFILHWKSVRPVPKVTIDFGDGRKLVRTITGNSIHYVLDASGQLVDALPGLYGADTFLAGLRVAEDEALKIGPLPPGEKLTALSLYHQDRLTALEANWKADLARIRSGPVPLLVSDETAPAVVVKSAPPAQVAGRLTAAKMAVEAPLLRGGKGGATIESPSLPYPSDELLKRIAMVHTESPSLDSGAKALLRSKGPNAKDAMRITISKSRVEDPMLRAFQNLELTIAEDTVRNEYAFHSRIHQWLARGHINQDVQQFNSRVYAELFLTPENDPYLGLVTPGTCSAIENDGLLQAANR